MTAEHSVQLQILLYRVAVVVEGVLITLGTVGGVVMVLHLVGVGVGAAHPQTGSPLNKVAMVVMAHYISMCGK
jgi:hypothetical protein